MKLKEFKEIINKCEKHLITTHTTEKCSIRDIDYGALGVCDVLEEYYGSSLKQLFVEIFCPYTYYNNTYWLGREYNEENLKNRLTFLRMFETMIIENKQYRLYRSLKQRN